MTIGVIDRIAPLGAFPVADFKDIDSLSSSQSIWYIDPVAGNDANTGVSSGTALATVRELNRRLRYLTLEAYEIYVLNDLPVTDPIGVTGIPLPANTSDITRMSPRIYWYGQKTVIASGTFTTNADNGTPVSNLAPSMTDSLVADWTTHVGKLVVVTSGPSAGFVAWVAKNLGAGVARCGYWWNPIATPVLAPPLSTPATPPVLGNTYDVVSLTKVRSAYSVPNQSFVNFSFEFSASHVLPNLPGFSSTFFWCGFTRSFSVPNNNTLSFSGCFMSLNAAGFTCGQPTSRIIVQRGSVFQRTDGTGIVSAGNGGVAWYINTLFQGVAVDTDRGGVTSFEPQGITGVPSGVFDSSFGAIYAFRGSTVVMSPNVYGSGNAYGLRVGSANTRQGNVILGSSVTPPYVTGTVELSINAKTQFIPPLTPGAAVPALQPCTTWAELYSAPFNRVLTDEGTVISP